MVSIQRVVALQTWSFSYAMKVEGLAYNLERSMKPLAANGFLSVIRETFPRQ